MVKILVYNICGYLAFLGLCFIVPDNFAPNERSPSQSRFKPDRFTGENNFQRRQKLADWPPLFTEAAKQLADILTSPPNAGQFIWTAHDGNVRGDNPLNRRATATNITRVPARDAAAQKMSPDSSMQLNTQDPTTTPEDRELYPDVLFTDGSPVTLARILEVNHSETSAHFDDDVLPANTSTPIATPADSQRRVKATPMFKVPMQSATAFVPIEKMPTTKILDLAGLLSITSLDYKETNAPRALSTGRLNEFARPTFISAFADPPDQPHVPIVAGWNEVRDTNNGSETPTERKWHIVPPLDKDWP